MRDGDGALQDRTWEQAIKASFKVSQWHWTSPTLISSDLDELTEPKSEIILAIGCCCLHSSGARTDQDAACLVSFVVFLGWLISEPCPPAWKFRQKLDYISWKFRRKYWIGFHIFWAEKWNHFRHRLLVSYPSSSSYGGLFLTRACLHKNPGGNIGLDFIFLKSRLPKIISYNFMQN